MMAETKKLYRSVDDRVILGVAGGLGEYFEIDPIIVRLIFVLLTIWGGAGLLFYIIGAIVIPEKPKGKKSDVEEGEVVEDPTEKIKKDAKDFADKTKAAAQDIAADYKTKPNRGAQIFGLIILFIGLSILVGWFFPGFSFEHLWPLVLIIIGLYLIFKPRGK
jgi:phage shock protein C